MLDMNLYRVFLLRLWQENDQSLDEPAPLRIVVEEPGSSERYSLSSLQALVSHLEAEMAKEQNRTSSNNP